jgi:protein-S-isoprenylcysteine O-methyltransferase Ste14
VIVASLSALVIEEFEFFPPPSKDSWQYRVFWVLFRIMFIGLLILSFHGFSPQPLFDNLVRYLVWLPLLILGFGIATYLSAKLGWANAHGEKDGLIVSGLYRWSRNPIYVASIVGIIGWSLFVNSCYVSTILALWAFMYFLAPFVEEPWLERSYGEDFLAYKGNSSRFFGLPKA